ncbi:hypothetical protein D3C72_1940540 [compost metagenome]
MKYLLPGIGTLHGDNSQRFYRARDKILASRDQIHRAFRRYDLRPDPLNIAVCRACVQDDTEVFILQVVDDEVIDHTSFVVKHARIECLA